MESSFMLYRYYSINCTHTETGTRGSESGGKLANYRQFKFFPKTKPYVRLNLPVTVRRVVAGLRAGCLPLQIEVLRTRVA